MADAQGASAFISDGAGGSPQTLSGVEIRRSVSPLLFNGTGRAFGARSGRRPGTGGVPTISGTTVSIPAGSAVVDAGPGNLDPAFLVSWGSSLPSMAGTPAHSSLPRIDVVYVRVTEVLGSPTTQTITFGYQAGTAASSPTPPTTVGVDNLPIGRVAVLGYINVPQSGSGPATVTPGPVVVTAGGVLPVNGSGEYPPPGTLPDGTVLWDYSPSVRDFVVLDNGAWSRRDTTPSPKIQRGLATVTTNSLGNGTVVFPGGAFPGVPTVVASIAGGGAGLTVIVVSPAGTTASQFTFTALNSNHDAMANVSVPFYWIAAY